LATGWPRQGGPRTANGRVEGTLRRHLQSRVIVPTIGASRRSGSTHMLNHPGPVGTGDPQRELTIPRLAPPTYPGALSSETKPWSTQPIGLMTTMALCRANTSSYSPSTAVARAQHPGQREYQHVVARAVIDMHYFFTSEIAAAGNICQTRPSFSPDRSTSPAALTVPPTANPAGTPGSGNVTRSACALPPSTASANCTETSGIPLSRSVARTPAWRSLNCGIGPPSTTGQPTSDADESEA